MRIVPGAWATSSRIKRRGSRRSGPRRGRSTERKGSLAEGKSSQTSEEGLLCLLKKRMVEWDDGDSDDYQCKLKIKIKKIKPLVNLCTCIGDEWGVWFSNGSSFDSIEHGV